MSKPKERFRVRFGLSIGDTVPLWSKNGWGHKRFYAFASKPCCCTYGCVGFKAWVVFVQISYGRGTA